MSLAALLEATRDELRTTLRLPDSQCKVSQDARPDPTIGKLFCCIYPSSWAPVGPEVCMGIDEGYGLNVGLTFTTAWVPNDRTENLYLAMLWGVEATARKVMRAVHQSYDIMTAANVIIQQRALDAGEVDPPNKIVEPLRWLATDTSPQEKTGEWLSGNDDGTVKAWLVNVYFGQARRLQTSANMV